MLKKMERGFAIAAIVFAVMFFAVPIKAHMPSQCVEYAGGSKSLEFQMLSMVEARRGKTALHDAARRTLDEAIALMEDVAYDTNRRNAKEVLDSVLYVMSAFQEAAITYENLANSLSGELEQYVEWSAKSIIMHAILVKCIQGADLKFGEPEE